MSHLIAGIDESMRPNAYLLCATVVSTADRRHLQVALHGLSEDSRGRTLRGLPT